MKTLPKSIVYLLLVAGVAIYSGCKKDQPETTVVTEDAALVTDTVSTPIDTTTIDTVKADANDVANGTSARNVKQHSNTKVKNSVSATAAQKEAESKSLKGYSAPDGTDAENKDGDQYTKNDNRRMPSGGSSIK